MSEQSKQPTPLDGVDPTKDPVGAVKACIKTWDELEIQNKQRNAEFLKGPAVASIQSGLIKRDADGKVIAQAKAWMKEWLDNNRPDGVFHHPLLGEVTLSMGGIKDSASKMKADIHINSIPAIPYVLEKSVLLEFSTDKNGEPTENYIIAAPIEVDGKRHYAVVRLKKNIDQKNEKPRFYVVAAELESDAQKNAAFSLQDPRHLSEDRPLTGGKNRLLNVLYQTLAVNALVPTGRTNPVKTAKGTKLNTQFAVVEADRLIVSHDANGKENPNFPQELQPRDRARETSQAWVQKVAANLDPDSLGRTSRADSGAPIVGSDAVVESGNGRTMAIKLAYERGTADEYRQWLIDDAEYFGLDADQIKGMQSPVLVRVRTSDTDRQVFVVEANQDDKLTLTATEQARSDAKRLDDQLLGLFAPGEDGDLLTSANQRFIQGFLKSLGETEAAQYMTTDGKPTKGLVDRIKAAIFSKAYNDDRLLEMMADQTKPEIQNVLNALGVAAPRFIEAQGFGRVATESVSEQMIDGIEQSLDQRVVDAVVKATNTLLAAKANNQDIAEYVKQQGLFEDIDEGVAALAVFLAKNGRSAKRMAIAFKAMATFVKNDALDQQNGGLFGEPQPPSMVDVVAAANRELQQRYGDDDGNTIGLFDSLTPIVASGLKAQLDALDTSIDPVGAVRTCVQVWDVIAQATTELSDDPNSPNYRYRDTGYIADSRKELAQNQIQLARSHGKMLRASDIDWDAIETNPRAAKELIIKSNLFGQVDWESLRDGGMEPGAGFLIDRIYASIGAEPAKDGPFGRKDYALGLETIRGRFEVCKTVPDVQAVLKDILDELNGVQLNADESAQYAKIQTELDDLYEQMSAYESRKEELTNIRNRLLRDLITLKSDQDKRKRRRWSPDPEIEAKIAELEPKVDAAEKDIKAWHAANPDAHREWITQRTPDGGIVGGYSGVIFGKIQALQEQRKQLEMQAHIRNVNESPTTRAWLTFGDRFFKLLNYRSYRGSDTFAGHLTNAKNGKINDWSWAEKGRVVVKRATKQEIGFQLKVAETLERVGGKDIKVESTQQLKEMLGFRDVQSGNWVLKDVNSAKYHVEQTAQAMSDLGDVLGIDTGMLGLGGRLAMAFGARGKGSSGWKESAARAHYESTHRVINLTKMGGGGSLGHEWFHAIDDMLSELVTQQVSETTRNFVTVNPELLPSGRIRDAVIELRRAMFTGTRRTPERIKLVPKKDKDRAKYNIDSMSPNSIAKLIKSAGNMTDAVLAVDRYFAGVTNPRALKNAKGWRVLAAAYYADEDAAQVDVLTGPPTSNFAAEAAFLDGGAIGKYWSRHHEMAARAFQSYLEDTLASQGRKNDYLSAYADNQYHIDPMFGIEWKPYPEGDERTAINAAFAQLFKAIQDEKVFEKAMQNEALLDGLFGGAASNIEDVENAFIQRGWQPTENGLEHESGRLSLKLLENDAKDDFYMVIHVDGDYHAEIGKLKGKSLINIFKQVTEAIGEDEDYDALLDDIAGGTLDLFGIHNRLNQLNPQQDPIGAIKTCVEAWDIADDLDIRELDPRGNDDVPSASGNLESDRQNATDPKPNDGSPDANGSGGTEPLTTGTRSDADRGGNEREPILQLPADDATGGGTPSHQQLYRPDGTARPASSPAGSADGSGSGGDRVTGSPTQRERNGSTLSHAVTTGSLAEKIAAQAAAPTETAWGDRDSIDASLPLLLPEQRDDVLKAEARLIEQNENGILFTNGTGTGKTYTGLGIAKRFANAGKANILIVTLNDKICRDFVSAGKNLGLSIHQLKGIDDHGGEQVVVTTYANFGQNKTLGLRDWDLIVVDESHTLMQSEKAADTAALKKLHALSGHHAGFDDWAAMRYIDQHPKPTSVDAEGKATYDDADLLNWGKFKAPLRNQWAENWKKQTGKRAKVIFLSATPFAYVPTVDWAEGYLFHYTDPAARFTNAEDMDGYAYNSGNSREKFFMSNFGYRMRYNRLTRPDGKVRADVMEKMFAEQLKRSGAMTGRELSVPFDYDRKFVLLESRIGTLIDDGFKFLQEYEDGYFRELSWALKKNFDHLKRQRLLEAIKAEDAIDQIRKHMSMGRKVVVFHDYNEGGSTNPFVMSNPHEDPKINRLYDEFASERPDLINMPLDLPSPIVNLTRAFPKALLFNGRVAKTQRSKNADLFNQDDSGHDLIIVQSDAGSTGISFHDTTGKHQRVIINIGMPQKPAKLRQTEGRIYRVGQASNAIHRYITTGTDWERSTFASKIAERAETVDNLAMGESSMSSIKDALIEAYEAAEYFEPSISDGVGGKALDEEKAKLTTLSDFDRAKTLFYGKGKNNKRRDQREGMDWYATAEPIGLKMVQFAGAKVGDDVLEPSAGDGAIGRFVPDGANLTMIEPSDALASRAQLNNTSANVIVSGFEDHEIVNKYDTVVMNPPFGIAGTTAIQHIEKALKHLRDRGRVVALIPRGAMDSKLDALLAHPTMSAYHQVANIELPTNAFENAGTSVRTRIVVIDRYDRAADVPSQIKRLDYSNADSIEDLFDRIADLEITPRKPRWDEVLEKHGVTHTVEKGKHYLQGESLPSHRSQLWSMGMRPTTGYQTEWLGSSFASPVIKFGRYLEDLADLAKAKGVKPALDSLAISDENSDVKSLVWA